MLSIHRGNEIAPYESPNPFAFEIAFNSRSSNRSLVEYSGNSSTLKQVCAVGSLRKKL